jgi:hypothetical protein
MNLVILPKMLEWIKRKQEVMCPLCGNTWEYDFDNPILLKDIGCSCGFKTSSDQKYDNEIAIKVNHRLQKELELELKMSIQSILDLSNDEFYDLLGKYEDFVAKESVIHRYTRIKVLTNFVSKIIPKHFKKNH